MAFDIANALQPSPFNPLGAMQVRTRNALDQSQENRTQTEFQNAQTDRLRQQTDQATLAQGKQTLAEVEWALQAPSKVQAINSLPHVVDKLRGQGLDPTQFSEDQATQILQSVRAHASAALGQGPPVSKPESIAPGGSLVTVGQDASGNPTASPLYTAPAKPEGLGTMYQYLDPASKKPVFGTAEQAQGQTPYNKPTSFELGAGSLTSGGLDLAAQDYRLNGRLPAGISRIPGASLKIINHAADQAASVGDTAQEAVLRRQSVAAAKSALSKISTQKALVGAYEKTATKNIDLALSLSDKLERSGSPLLNKGIIAFRQNITGDPATAQFVNALTAARTEYAKVLSGATGAAGITDAARGEANDLFSKVSSAETLRAVFGVAKQEMGNRMSSFDDQLAEINQSTGATPIPAPPAATTGWTVTKKP